MLYISAYQQNRFNMITLPKQFKTQRYLFKIQNVKIKTLTNFFKHNYIFMYVTTSTVCFLTTYFSGKFNSVANSRQTCEEKLAVLTCYRYSENIWGVDS